jgi:hypothetical protein
MMVNFLHSGDKVEQGIGNNEENQKEDTKYPYKQFFLFHSNSISPLIVKNSSTRFLLFPRTFTERLKSLEGVAAPLSSALPLLKEKVI